MKYYIDSNGNYLGGSDSTPLSAIEVAAAPQDAREIWNGTQWGKSKARLESRRKRLIKEHAQARIIKLKPSWTRENHKTKQRNLLMRGNILLLNLIKAIQTGIQADIDTAMTKAEQAASIVPKIRKIRKMSNLAEINGDSLAKFKTDIKAAGL